MSFEKERLEKLLDLANDLESFRLCGPSDDPDKQTAVIYEYKHQAKIFIANARKIVNQELQESLESISTDIDSIYEVYDLVTEIQIVIDTLRDISKYPVQFQFSSVNFVDPQIIEELRQVEGFKFDLSKVIRFCEELNSSFNANNYLASALLLRSLINHVPPIFGHNSFDQVVAQVSKSRKDLFKHLDEVARKVADLHTHDIIRAKERLPTKNQLVPFQASLEFLLGEILVEAKKSS
jgi:hypothetical protein